MLRIGELAWLGQVTVETLRHYDRLGLLKPAHLDQSSGYRTRRWTNWLVSTASWR